MSSFLGPIHFWLYDKIKFQESLALHFYDFALRNGRLDSSDSDSASLVKKEIPPLEDSIDTMNIHGWLQERIHDAESRYAKLITRLTGKIQSSELEKIAFEFGKMHPVGKVPVREAYKIFEDSFLNGMPCDRVNVITQKDDFCIGWEQTQDIHGAYWLHAGGCPEIYYKLRKNVMSGMLNGSGLALENFDYLHYSIKKEEKCTR